jgi:hypothetical protein
VSGGLQGVPLARLELMAAAGREMAAAERALAKQGFNVVGRLLRDEGPFYEWDHYPPGDVYDRLHGAQYFYHAHGAAQRPAAEHGHFHTFLRPAGPDPLTLSGHTGSGEGAPLHHLIAIAVDHASQPIRLFTVNRWVTQDVFIDASATIALLDRFILDTARPSRWVNRWLAAATRLFRPEIERLLRERDEALAAWRPTHPGEDPLGAHELEILSELPVSVAAQRDAVARAVGRATKDRR